MAFISKLYILLVQKKVGKFRAFTKRNIRPYKLNSIRTKFLRCQTMFFTCSPPSLKSGSTSDCMHKVRLAPLIRAGQYLCTEQGSTSAPSRAVPLHRAGQYLCTERGVLPHPERGVLPHPERRVHHTLSGGYITLRVEGTLHPERGVSAHSFGWDIHSKVGLRNSGARTKIIRYLNAWFKFSA